METITNVTCQNCDREYTLRLTQYKSNLKRGRKLFCSTMCANEAQFNRVKTNCFNCGKDIFIIPSSVGKHNFCSQSCSATYTNKHKTFGIRRSKMEIAVSEKIKADYPKLTPLSNDKIAIDSELDFYFPQLRLAIELNGIVHYEPIYGQDTFRRIRNNDSQKSMMCRDKGIELAVIDISRIKKVTPQSIEWCYSIVKDLVARNIGRAK